MERLEACGESACLGKAAQVTHGQATGHKCLQEAPCVSRTEGARLGSRGWGGRGSPMSPQGLAEGRGPEDSRHPPRSGVAGGNCTIIEHL